VRAVLEEDLMVTTLPGASSVMAALTLGGLPTDRFLFAGFLAPKQAARRTALADLRDLGATLVFLESARRLAATLADMEAVLGERQVAVAREITKKFEEVRRGTCAELAEHYAQAGPPKGEVVIVVGPPQAQAAFLKRAQTTRQLPGHNYSLNFSYFAPHKTSSIHFCCTI